MSGTTVPARRSSSGSPRSCSSAVVPNDSAPDEEDELVGEAVGERDPFLAPEESAMSVRDEAPGAVDHPDDHTERDDADPNTE